MRDAEHELESLKAVNRAAHSAFISMDETGVITWWNPAAERLFGWQSDEVIGRTVADVIVPPEVREAHWRGLTHFLATGEGPVLDKLIEVEAVHRDDSRMPVELTITTLKIDQAWTFHAFVRDIRGRRRADSAAAEAMVKASIAAARADEYDRALTDYHRLSRHRLANPLASILGAAITLQTRTDLDDTTRSHLLDAIVQQAQALEVISLDPLPMRLEELGLRPTPEPRQQRLIDNERFFRGINADIAASAEMATRDRLPFICECSNSGCAQVIYLDHDQYCDVRSRPDNFAVAPGHERGEIERVSQRNERYWIVERLPASE